MPFSINSPTIREKQEYTWRSMTRDDIPEVWDLLQKVNRQDESDYSQTIQDLNREFDNARSNPRTDGRIIRTIQGKLAAFVRIFVNPAPTRENVANVWCEIAPDEREQGVEQECLDWIEDRAAERLAESAQADGAADLPRVIRVIFAETACDNIIFYEHNGFRHVRSLFKMERDLRVPIPDKPLPPGLTLRTYGEDIDDSMLECLNEAFSDHWGSQPITAQEWHPFEIDRSGVRRDLTLVVMDGDEVVAFCLNLVKELENKRDGVRRGWISRLATRRRYRHQGIGSALMVETMRRFRALGFDSIGLGVDAENMTGALSLYEGLGFKAVKTRVVLEKRVG